MLSRYVDDLETLVHFMEECIPRLIYEGVFKPEEILNENVLKIVKAPFESASAQ